MMFLIGLLNVNSAHRKSKAGELNSCVRPPGPMKKMRPTVAPLCLLERQGKTSFVLPQSDLSISGHVAEPYAFSFITKVVHHHGKLHELVKDEDIDWDSMDDYYSF